MVVGVEIGFSIVLPNLEIKESFSSLILKSFKINQFKLDNKKINLSNNQEDWITEKDSNQIHKKLLNSNEYSDDSRD